MRILVRDKVYTIKKSTRKGKQYMVTGFGLRSPVHFGDIKMPEFPGTKRGNAYCSRSYGIKGRGNIQSPNFWSRLMWSCKGKKSISKRRFKRK